MPRHLLAILLALFGHFFMLQAQERYTLSGTISEASSNETLIGVTVAISELKTGTTTNEYGFYSITLPKGQYQVIISYLGFQEVVQTINLNQDLRQNFSLVEKTEELQEVVVTEDVERLDIKKPQMSVTSLASNTIKQIPVVLGESDVI